MKIYEATYNDCIHESAYSTISLHKTYAGAKDATERHKANKQKEYDEWNHQNHQNKINFTDNDYNYCIQPWQDWKIFETELLD